MKQSKQYYTMPDLFNASNEEKQTPENSKFVVQEPIEQTIPISPDEEHHVHSLSAFCKNPHNIAFEKQEQDEKILLLLRAHGITNLPWIVIALILLLIPLILQIIFNALPFSFFTLPLSYTITITIFYYLIVSAFALINFITWFYNTFLVTNKRIVDIDFSDVLYHNLAVTKLSSVQDVDYTQTGVIRSFFNYGDVTAQTAGDKMNFDALGVPKPSDVVHIIGNLIGKKTH